MSWKFLRVVFSEVSKLVGVHRVQRVPGNDKRGRRHSSSVIVTVAGSDSGGYELAESDLIERFHRGSGNGGQHQNTSDSAVVLTHVPSGLSVEAQGRSQWRNRQDARIEMAKRLVNASKVERSSERRQLKAEQISGQRSFSWTAWRDEVRCHETGTKMSMKQALKGKLGKLAR